MSAPDDRSLFDHALRLGDALVRQGKTVATAESCTGGWIAKCLTDIPGSSRWFEWGVVAYANRAKSALLGVPARTIEEFGAVSESVVESMALGAQTQSRAAYAIAVSGIAGPDGGTADKPVGTVWIGWAARRAWARRYHFDGSREAVRRWTVHYAIKGLLEHLDSG